MSAFLGRVHFILFNKVCECEKLNQQLIEKFNLNSSEVDACSLPIVFGPLEEMIDENNIHGWLLNQVEATETRLNYILNTLKDQKEDVKAMFYANGKSNCTLTSEVYLDDLFRTMHSYLLDGMPCDGGMSIEDRDDTSVTFKYYDDAHSKIDCFDLLMDCREAWINGYISELPYTCMRVKPTCFKLEVK